MKSLKSKHPKELLDNLITKSRKIYENSDSKIINVLRYDFCAIFNDLRTLSTEQRFFWMFCDYSVYEFHFEERSKSFLSTYVDSDENLFIESEIENINKSYRGGILYFFWEIGLKWDFTGSPYEKGVNKVRVEIPLDFLDFDMIKNIQFSQRKKVDFLTSKSNSSIINITKEYNNKVNDVEFENWHPRIFKELKHFNLFEHLHDQIDKNKLLAEYSFIYWSMKKDNFIYEGVKPTEFIIWLNEYYDVDLFELKQLYRVTGGGKSSNYQTAKLLFKC